MAARHSRRRFSSLMKQPQQAALRRVSATALVLLLAVTVQGCGGSPPATRAVCGACEGPDRFVRLQSVSGSRDAESRRHLSHPIALSQDEWKILLAGVRVQSTTSFLIFFSKKDTDQPLFTQEHIEFLGPSLSRAFAEARPDERAVFGLTERESSTIDKMTTGGFFFEGDALHLVLANYRFAVTMPGIRELLINDPLRPNTGRMFELVAGPHQAIVPNSRAGRSLLDPDPAELAIGYQPLLAAAQAGTPVAIPQDRRGGSEIGSASSPAPASLEQRLDRLKRLRERGLITEDEYREKKRHILEGL